MEKIKEWLPTVLIIFYIVYLSILGSVELGHLGIFICLSFLFSYNLYHYFKKESLKEKPKDVDPLSVEKLALEKAKIDKEIRELSCVQSVDYLSKMEELLKLKVDVDINRLRKERNSYMKHEEEARVEQKIKF